MNCNHNHLYSQKCHLIRHAKTNHAKLRFKCNYCGKKFRQDTQKNEHLKLKHGKNIIKWQCPFGCNQFFSQFRGVRRHINSDIIKCNARSIFFDKQQIHLLKRNWDNSKMSKILKFCTDNDITKEMQNETRKKVKVLINQMSLNKAQ